MNLIHRNTITSILLSIFLAVSCIVFGQQEMNTTYFNRADSMTKSRNYQNAIELYRLFIDSENRSKTPDWEKISESWNNIGVCYYNMREFESAVSAFQVSLEIDKSHNLSTLSSRLSNMGFIYKTQGYLDKAIVYYKEALSLAEDTKDTLNTAKILNNLGSIYSDWGQFDEAIECFEKSLRIKEEINDRSGIAKTLNNIGSIYQSWKKYDQAILNFKEALLIDMDLNDKVQMAGRLNNIGLSFFNLDILDSAMAYYKKALDLNIELGLKDGIATQYNNLGMLYQKKNDIQKADNYLHLALKMYRELNMKLEIAKILSNLGYNESLKSNYVKAIEYLQESIDIAKELNLQDVLLMNYNRLTNIYSNQNNYKLALEYFKKAKVINDSIFSAETHEQIANFQVKYETERQQREIEILQQKEIISNLRIHRQKTLRNSLFGVISVVILFLIGIIYMLRSRIRSNNIIAGEKAKTDQLLLNILPEKVATELKEGGSTKPETFDNVTVLFSDLCNFTDLSSGLTPEFIINELNQIFSQFDAIIEKHHGERIKTIGDAYMAVCGLPTPDPNHVENIVSAAIEIMQYMEERRRLSPVKWQIRIGIHTGSVVAGVVGVKKYIYDVFGDTVNTASRMESYSAPMRINVSESTYNLVKDKFKFTERDSIEIKGKGRLKMFFIEI